MPLIANGLLDPLSVEILAISHLTPSRPSYINITRNTFIAEKTRSCNGLAVRLKGNKPRGQIWLKQKQNEKNYTTKKVTAKQRVEPEPSERYVGANDKVKNSENLYVKPVWVLVKECKLIVTAAFYIDPELFSGCLVRVHWRCLRFISKVPGAGKGGLYICFHTKFYFNTKSQRSPHGKASPERCTQYT